MELVAQIWAYRTGVIGFQQQKPTRGAHLTGKLDAMKEIFCSCKHQVCRLGSDAAVSRQPMKLGWNCSWIIQSAAMIVPQRDGALRWMFWRYAAGENGTICSLPPCLHKCPLLLTLSWTVLLFEAHRRSLCMMSARNTCLRCPDLFANDHYQLIFSKNIRLGERLITHAVSVSWRILNSPI